MGGAGRQVWGKHGGGRRSVPWAWPRGCRPEPSFRLSALTAGSQQLPPWPSQGLNGLLVE